jgi:transcriptional regulator with XRE-family HTH domain
LENLFTAVPGEALRLLRVTAKKKQREIAPIFGVDRTTYVGYEKLDEVKLTPDQVQKLAKLYGISVMEFQQKVGKVGRESDGSISMPREVWNELKENNSTYKEFLSAYRSSFDNLVKAVERTMDNLSKPGGGQNTQETLPLK